MHQTLPPSLSSAEREPSPTVRVTVPVRQDVLDTFQRLAKAGSMSTGRAMGEWLADTIEAASFMAEKLEQARAAPRIVAREMHAYALGLADETGALLEGEAEGTGGQGAGTGASRPCGRGSRPLYPPPCNTGESPKGRQECREEIQVKTVATKQASSPVTGLFRFPVGVWVSPYRMGGGLIWWKPLKGATRMGVLGGAI